MKSLKRAIANFLTRRTENAIPLAPPHFVLTTEQLEKIEQLGIQKIHLTFRKNVGVVIARTFWRGGEKDSFLPWEIRFAPHQPFLLIRRESGHVEIRAGLVYHSLPAEKFQVFLGHVLDCSQESIRFISGLRYRAQDEERRTMPWPDSTGEDAAQLQVPPMPRVSPPAPDTSQASLAHQAT